jgi:hypothetical protein
MVANQEYSQFAVNSQFSLALGKYTFRFYQTELAQLSYGAIPCDRLIEESFMKTAKNINQINQN